ncbi:MAG: type II toxin-antitoxin system HipA family toxin [Rhodospirillales bacterium]
MISDSAAAGAAQTPEEAYVWIWLPGAAAPVVAGRIFRNGDVLAFNYGQSYLARPDAVPLYEPELPLGPGAVYPTDGHSAAGCLRDAAPDAWGRRVILNRMLGKGGQADTDALGELTYFLESGSDRIGALDFQRSPAEYTPRAAPAATLEELLESAERVERGVLLTRELDQALFHGSSIGGARPKAMLEDGGRKLIAKFSMSSDIRNVVKAEFIAMRLAAKAGLSAAPVELARAAGKDVLLIERFDRVRAKDGWRRRAMVSALTMLGLDEMTARYASYEDLAEIIRRRFTQPKETLRELFGRIVFNILCGNTDDHARNHAAFWDGARLTLTPAYDICPQNRTGNEASQAMLIKGDDRMSRLASCIAAAPGFLMRPAAAEDLIAEQISRVREAWPETAEEAELTEADRALLAGRAFFNPSIFEGAPARIKAEKLLV